MAISRQSTSYRFDQCDDQPKPSLLSAADRAEVAAHVSLVSAQRRAFGDGAARDRNHSDGSKRDDGGNRGRGNGYHDRGNRRWETTPAPVPAPSPSLAPAAKGSKGGKGGKGGKGKSKGKGKPKDSADPAAAQEARATNERDADAAAN